MNDFTAGHQFLYPLGFEIAAGKPEFRELVHQIEHCARVAAVEEGLFRG